MKESMYELLERASKPKKKEDRIKILQENLGPQLAETLRLAYDDRIEWLLPEGEPPYKPNVLLDQENVYYAELRKFYLFVKGGNDKLNQTKREKIFIDILEMVSPLDAKLVLCLKDRKLPFGSLSKELIQGAFPQLFFPTEAA